MKATFPGQIARPRLEALEPRFTPSVSVTPKGNLYIQASDASDTVVVRNVTLDGVAYFEVTENAVTTHIRASQVSGTQVYFYGLGGDDRFENRSTLTAVAFGGTGNDVLISDQGGYLDGEEGNDVLTVGGGPGENVLHGGDGNDTLTGGSGRDLLYGGAGNDTILAGAGNDYIEGGQGNDTIDAGDGNDLVHGGAGNDVLRGGAGNDQLNGGGGVDWIYGGGGDDVLWGGTGELSGNYLFGGDGNDTLYGGDGGDYMYGEAGSDRLIGAGGGDRMFGGAGLDYLWGEAGNDVLDGGQDGLADYLDGGAGRDSLRQEFYWVAGIWYQRERMPGLVVGVDTVYR